ncbi:MAG: pyridoxamine 5'-phosphate oxidase family protein [Pyrinomonadaceae bacterium]
MKEQAMKSVYHRGEIAVQAQAGVRGMAERVGRSIHTSFPLAAQEFLREQPMALIGSVNVEGRAWASLVTGEPGFLQVIDEQTLMIGAQASSGDPLMDNLKANAEVGLLAIEFATRRRMRVNGTAELHPEGIAIHAAQVYSNCPKYIQARAWRIENARSYNQQSQPSVERKLSLSEKQQMWIAESDTFFIATHHQDGGGDVSHRGGMPGFVRVVDRQMLAWGDYSGNTMFQTLGNIVENPAAGLLFIDWERGSTLQLTGRARVVWEPERFEMFAGAERAVEFAVDEVTEIPVATNLRWQLLDYSPFNPA